MRILPRFLALGSAVFLLAIGQSAAAQGFGPGMGSGFGGPAAGGFGGPTGSSKKKPPPKKPEEETHAASNTEGMQSVQTQEPTLPPDPLAIPAWAKGRIGTDGHPELEKGRGSKTETNFYGLYLEERSDKYRFRTIIPPLWAERDMPGDRASLFGLYYNRRSKDVDVDALLPFFLKMRDHDVSTTVVFPFMHRERKASATAPSRQDNWLAPIYFQGSSGDGSGYFHVPALLTYTKHTARDGFNLVGPMFCSWKGGPTCDRRTADTINLGLAPLYFYGRDKTSEYEIVPPLLHYYHYDEIANASTTVWGPYFSHHTPESDSFNIAPLFFRSWGKNESSTTVFPLFHHSYKGNTSLTITPLFMNSVNEKGDHTFASWVYAKYRGRTELDMFTPLVWRYSDPDVGLTRFFALPFFYKGDSPRSHDLAIFPFYGHFTKPGISETTFYTPLVRHSTTVNGWETDIFPFFYSGRTDRSSHLVVAPFLWDFVSPGSRKTVALPLFVRVEDQTSVNQLALNTFYRERKVPGGRDWEFHFFPVFSYGESPTGYFWNFLYGLAGYTREGTASRARALYIPIPLSN